MVVYVLVVVVGVPVVSKEVIFVLVVIVGGSVGPVVFCW